VHQGKINISIVENNETQPERIVYTISELNQMVSTLLEDAFLPIWVEGEISNFASPASGHWYFSLKDASAQVRCAMFQGRNRSAGFQPSNGAQVLARAKIGLYEPRGDFQLIVDYIEEAGDGALRRAFEILKARLIQEGLCDATRKKSLPTIPRCVGVITSPTGAAIRDILTVLKRRFPSIPVIIYPTAVQGQNAATQIARALQLAEQRAECDVLILARGGGSLEDLAAFNEEIVARAMFACGIPIVSAVGHEIDFTIADFVADKRAPTPSAAAEMVSPDCAEWSQRLHKLYRLLVRCIQHEFSQVEKTLAHLIKRLRHPGQRIRDQTQRIDDLEQRLQRTMQVVLQQAQHKLANLSRALNTVSPLATLSRGYAIVTRKETSEILRSIKQTFVGDSIAARLGDGQLSCEVKKIN
jgi:exodeoxyribonuclease VII large subunit